MAATASTNGWAATTTTRPGLARVLASALPLVWMEVMLEIRSGTKADWVEIAVKLS